MKSNDAKGERREVTTTKKEREREREKEKIRDEKNFCLYNW